MRFLLLALACLAGYALLVFGVDALADWRLSTIAAGKDPAAAFASAENERLTSLGRTLFLANCANCHGPTGLGDGVAGATLNPKPRNYAGAQFRFTSTVSGLPSDADFARIIRGGLLPAMPGFPTLSDDEVRALTLTIRQLSYQGHIAEQLQRDPRRPIEVARERARVATTSGPLVQVPPRPAAVDLAKGKKFYDATCAACHDPDGRSILRDDLVDNDDNPIRARDLTTVPYKAGHTEHDILIRILRGVPGAPMPAFTGTLSPEDLWSTAAYVRSLQKNK